MHGMNAAPGAQLGGFEWFTATWLLMMAAMMLPCSVPMVRPPPAGRPGRRDRRQILGPIATVVTYLAVWTAAGALTYLALRTGRWLFGSTFEWHQAGQWLCVAVVAVAAGYQLTESKYRWLARCHAPALSPGVIGAEALRAGSDAGFRCLASSWALMATLFALGAMSIVWMAVIGVLIAVERLTPIQWWHHRPSIRAMSAALLVALAAALAISPTAVPGFTVPASAPNHSMSSMSG